MIYLGIDPGMDGFIVALSGDNNSWTWDKIPTIPKKSGGRDYDVAGIANILRRYSLIKTPILACIERVSIFPVQKKDEKGKRQTSMHTNSTQFYCSGAFHGIFHAYKIPFVEVHVISWKKKILEGLGGDKSVSVRYVNNRYPRMGITKLPKKYQHNLADAVCITLYGQMTNPVPRGLQATAMYVDEAQNIEKPEGK